MTARTLREVVRVEVGERRQRAGAELAGVVDQEVQPRADGLGQRGAVRGVGDVAGDGGDRAAGAGAAAAASSGPASRPSTTSRQPRSVECAARARPRPREAPVISAVRVFMGLPSDLKWT